MTIEISNQQRALGIQASRLRRLAAHFVGLANNLTAAEPWGSVSFVLVDDDGIRRLNNRFMSRDEPTDVLCFAYAPFPGVAEPRSAEIYVNAERARKIGARFGGVAREMALYLAHGCNHLTGADDATPAQRRRMRRRELRWLDSARSQGMLTGLLAR